MLLLYLLQLSSVACAISSEPFCSSEVCLPADYNQMDLPNTRGPLVVKTTILLKDIFEVHPETFTLDLSLYIRLEWVDNRINLTKDGSFSVDKSFLSSIWKPDLFIWDLNGEQSYSDKITMSSITVVRKSGSKDLSVIYVLELDVNFVCAMDFSLFPFDTSQCKFRLSAFTFDESKVLTTNPPPSVTTHASPMVIHHALIDPVFPGAFLVQQQPISRLAADALQDPQLRPPAELPSTRYQPRSCFSSGQKMISDETREASWETEGTFYSVAGVGPVLPQVQSQT